MNTVQVFSIKIIPFQIQSQYKGSGIFYHILFKSWTLRCSRIPWIRLDPSLDMMIWTPKSLSCGSLRFVLSLSVPMCLRIVAEGLRSLFRLGFDLEAV